MVRRLSSLSLLICCTLAAFAQVPSSNHVFLVVEENHSSSSVIGNSAMPYLNGLAQKYGYASQYYANAHFSIPNYFALTAAQVVETSDGTTRTYSQDNIVRRLVQGGKSWKSYAESLPSVGFIGGDVLPYAQSHNPFAYYTDVISSSTQTSNLVPFSQFATDLSNGTLPNFSFIVPNEQHDGHDGSDAVLDSWLHDNIDPLIQSAVFQQDGILVITFDESVDADTAFGGGQVTTIVVGPKVKSGFQSSVFYQHESVLKMLMEALGLTTPLAATALAPDMADFFGGTISRSPVSISPPTLFFGYPPVGTVSGIRTATLTNNQSAPLNINTTTTSSHYTASNNCPAQLPAGASCTINVTFTPVTSGIQHGAIAISDDGPGSPHVMYLAGTGAPGTTKATPAPTITAVSPNSGPAAGGTVITVTGSDFLPGPSVSIGGIAATNVILNSSSQITATAPAHSWGLLDVRVTNSDGQQATLPGAFKVNQVAVTTYHNDNARTGLNAQEETLTPATVNASNFGKLSSCDLTPDGGISNAFTYAEPLYVPNVTIGGTSHNVVYVATERNQVFAFDADASPCQQLWKKTFEPFLQPNASQNYLADTIGIQSTPVIDLSTNIMYFVTTTGTDGANRQLLHAIDISTGTDKQGSPVTISGSVAGTGDGGTVDTFDANLQNQRPALLMANGNIYIAWGSYDDNGQDTTPSYHGWVIAYQANSLQRTAVFNTTPNGHAGSNWALGALAADSSGHVYTGAGNGNSNCTSNCDDTDPANSNFAHAYMRLDGLSLALQDYFIPFDWQQQTLDDQDVNGGAAVLLPDQPGSHPHLMVWGSKGGKVYLVDRDNMGHLSTTGNDSQIVQSFQEWTPDSCAGDDASCVRTLPAYWNGNIYFLVQNHGLQAFSLSNGLLSTTPSSEDTSVIYPMRGAQITVSANGNTNGIVWALNYPGHGLPSTLYAYDASDASSVLYNSDQNGSRDGLEAAQNFTTAMVANGKVYVATRKALSIFGLLNGSPAPGDSFTPSSLTFPSQQVGSTSASQSITFSNGATTAVTINGITASGDFAQTNNCGATLAAGAACKIAATFRPTAPGKRTGSITITDSAMGSPHVVSLTGTAVTPGALTVTPTSLNFSAQQVGTISDPQSIVVSNTGGSPVTIASVAASADFAQTNTCGATLNAGTSCNVAVTFAPTVASTKAGTLTLSFLTAAGGASQSVQVALNVLAASGPVDFAMSVSPQSATVQSGQTANYAVTITPANGFTGSVTLSCLGLPVHSTCSFNPNPVDATKGTASLQISTGVALADASAKSRIFYAAFISSVSIFGIMLIPWRRKKVMVGLCAVVICSFLFQVGCGGGAAVSSGSSTPPATQTTVTTPGNYTVTVVGTAGALQHSVTVQLVVQ